MKNERMTPEWVVENFLPDGDEKFRKWADDNYKNPNLALKSNHDFVYANFHESLLYLLEEQRYECAKVYSEYDSEDTDYESVSEAIDNAPIPRVNNINK